MSANTTTFRKGDDRAWRAPLKHGGRSRTLWARNRKGAERRLRRELAAGQRAYWGRMAIRLEYQLDCVIRYLEKEGGPVSPRGQLKRCLDYYLRCELALQNVYRLIENRQVEEDDVLVQALMEGRR